MGVPLFATSLDPHKPRLLERIAAVVDGGRFVLGPEVEAFERELADHLGVAHAVGVANGTDAISIALRALGVAAGDEVVVPSYTFYASVEAIAAIGAVPVYADIDPETFNVTAGTVAAALTERTRAILAVHLFGNPAPVAEIAALGPPVVEDAAQAIGASLGGARAGSLGTLATFSFFPSKNLPCLGDGGAVTTNDGELAAAVRRLRFHGSEDKQTFTEVGWNSRLDELQAAVLRELLPHLDGWNAARRRAAGWYEQHGLGDHAGLPRALPGAEPVHHMYVVRGPDAGALEAAGVGARRMYPVPAHRQPATARYARGDLPGTDEAARTAVAIPMGPELTEPQVREVVAACASGST
jgi:dTDP-4-amino-4,6-dideoxygalactose transaminase